MKNNPQFRVIDKGFKCLAPFNEKAREILSKHKANTILTADIRKPRGLKFHNKLHALGKVVMDNVQGFECFSDAHDVLKELQLIGNIKCVSYKYFNEKTQEWETRRIAKSMSFAKMDGIEFEELYNGICNLISQIFWPGMTREQIEQMAEFMPD